MKRIVFTALACTVAATASFASPAVKAPVEHSGAYVVAERASGTIMNVNAEAKSFVLVVEEKEVTVTYGAATKFFLDGKEVDAARLLQVGSKVTVSHENNVASKVEGTSKSAFLAEQASGSIASVNTQAKSFVVATVAGQGTDDLLQRDDEVLPRWQGSRRRAPAADRLQGHRLPREERGHEGRRDEPACAASPPSGRAARSPASTPRRRASS